MALTLHTYFHDISEDCVGATRTDRKKVADLPADGGIYTSVLVAVFGGVRVGLRNGHRSRPVHPFVLLILCMPVVAMQFISIWYLRADLPLEQGIHKADDPDSASLVKLKWLMVFVMYLTNYKKIQTAVLHIAFIMNPMNWVEVKRPRVDQWLLPECALRCCPLLLRLSLWPSVLAALLLKFWANYTVCRDSVSIILSAGTAKDIIFDSLAISFVAELSDAWWEFCAHTFHFESFANFEFEMFTHRRSPTQDLDDGSPSASPNLRHSVKWLYKKTLLASDNVHSVLSTGYGGNRIVSLFSMTALVFVYSKYLITILHAVDTDRLPVVRDLCTQYRLLEMMDGGASSAIGISGLWALLRQWVMVDVLEMDNTLKKFKPGGPLWEACSGEHPTLQHMPLSEQFGLAWKYRRLVGSFALMGTAVFVIPRLLRESLTSFQGDFEDGAEGKDDRQHDGQV